MPPFGNAQVTVENVTHTLDLQIKVEGQTLVVEWSFSSTGAKAPPVVQGQVVFDFNTQPANHFLMHVPPNAVPLAICLAGCVGKSLIEPVIECLAKNRNPNDILNCLKGKRIQITAHALACALECLAKHTV